MQYLGGKELIAKEIVAYMQPVIDTCEGYIEPFVGGFSIACRVEHSNIIASDTHEALITMYKALQDGWVAPDVVTEEDYKRLKLVKDAADPLTAFAGFGCAFSGRYFEGYARSARGINYAKSAKNSLLKKISRQPNFKGIDFRRCDYTEYSNMKGKFLYCDPPYKNTKEFSVRNFDTEKFFGWCAAVSKHNVVVISELDAPEDFVCVKEIPKRRGLRKGGTHQEVVTEKLFMHKNRVKL